uniref:Uncharacterized protein n=1 Tax=Micrurus corallinus TaxID=54390 RepID=A0A2D4EYA7_MICCO
MSSVLVTILAAQSQLVSRPVGRNWLMNCRHCYGQWIDFIYLITPMEFWEIVISQLARVCLFQLTTMFATLRLFSFLLDLFSADPMQAGWRGVAVREQPPDITSDAPWWTQRSERPLKDLDLATWPEL